MKNETMARAALCGAWLQSALLAHAAGGHFDVDDATMLSPGHCQYEAWVSRIPSASQGNVHFGPACRVGPVELGLNVDRPTGNAESSLGAGPALKWVADPLIQPFSAGVAWSAAFDTRKGGRPVQTLYVPVTWWASSAIQVHANVGADWRPGVGRTRRIGLAGEWAPSDAVSILGERIQSGGEWLTRIGLRWNLNAAISVDLSAARIGAAHVRGYTLGLNHEFER